jgi:hypothetical protein
LLLRVRLWGCGQRVSVVQAQRHLLSRLGYRQHAIVTLFGQIVVRLPRFRCGGCGAIVAGMEWPPHARSTPELDRLRAQLSALMSYRTAAELDFARLVTL